MTPETRRSPRVSGDVWRRDGRPVGRGSCTIWQARIPATLVPSVSNRDRAGAGRPISTISALGRFSGHLASDYRRSMSPKRALRSYLSFPARSAGCVARRNVHQQPGRCGNCLTARANHAPAHTWARSMLPPASPASGPKVEDPSPLRHHDVRGIVARPLPAVLTGGNQPVQHVQQPSRHRTM